jgi:hypothetical protein
VGHAEPPGKGKKGGDRGDHLAARSPHSSLKNLPIANAEILGGTSQGLREQGLLRGAEPGDGEPLPGTSNGLFPDLVN